MSEIRGVEVVERLPEPLEGHVYRVEKVEFIKTLVQGLEGWRVTLVDVKDGSRHATMLWKREHVGPSSKLGCFVKAFKDFFNDAEKALNTSLWVGNLVEAISWKPKNRTIKVLRAAEASEESVDACLEAIKGKLEPGRAYTVDDVRQAGVDYADQTIEEAFRRLEGMGKAYRLPTKPAKWFIEG
jgi:hypothetical protein